MTKHNLNQESLAASVVYVRPSHINCPHCRSPQDGWYCDPRGAASQCDDCGGNFTVNEDASIVFDV